MKNLACYLTIGILLLTVTSARGEFTPIAGWDEQLYPSYILATAKFKKANEDDKPNVLGDSLGLLGVIVESPSDEAPVTVTISCDEIMQPSIYRGTLETAGEQYSILPKIKYNYDKLSKIRQATLVNVTYRVEIDGELAEEQIATLTVCSVNDCPLNVTSGSDLIDTSFTFSTYVNEQHPFTDKLLREALDTQVVNSFSGYQAKSHDEVFKQVFAIWTALVNRDVRYSSITANAIASNTVCSQHVRLIEETIGNSQANCVDGSVLLVSMLRKIGIESMLVLVPGHCYVLFYVDGELQHPVAIETTLLGTQITDLEKCPPDLENAIPEESRDPIAWNSFVTALMIATEAFVQDSEKFKSSNEPQYKIISIRNARDKGILPIAFDGNSEFEKVVYYVDTDESEESEAISDDEMMKAEDSDEDDTDEDDDEGEEEEDQ